MPSTTTVQAPQTPCSQPTWVPVAPDLVTQEIRQQHARLGLAFDRLAVQGETDRDGADLT